jgi:type III secretion system chaperone SycN
MHIINAVETLGKQMNIDIKLNDDGVCSLNVGEADSLFMERKDDVLAISLARKVQGDIMPVLEMGLELCHLKNDPRLGLRIALFREDTIVAICKLEKHHINAGMVEQILPYLFEVVNKIT